MILLVLACGPHRELPEVVELPRVLQREEAPALVAEAPPPAAGHVVDGRWVDEEGLSVPLASGWKADPGVRGHALRVRLTPPEGAYSVEIWLTAFLPPPEREGCQWGFQDEGPYGTRPLWVTTCVPDEPLGAVAMDTVIQDGERFWHFVAVLPPGTMEPGRRAVDALVAGARLGPGEGG